MSLHDQTLIQETPAPGPDSADPPADRERRSILGGLAAAAGVAAVASIAKAGPLDPPAGPVATTAKPLAEIEPRRAVNATNTPGDAGAVYVISQPGSYYLTGNISVPSNSTGVRIGASGVTLDLNGFQIAGASTSNSTGISEGGRSISGVTVRNGSVVGVAGTGISLGGTSGVVIEDVTVRDCSGHGIVAGARARIARVLCFSNSGDGISVGDDAIVTGCVARSHTLHGIHAGLSALVEDCVSTHNGGVGISCSNGSVVRRCVAVDNGTDGINTFGLVGTCIASNNASRGIAAADAVVVGCAARANNGPGIRLDIGVAEECASSLSVSPAWTAHGFELVSRASVIDSTAYTNQGMGISAAMFSRAEGCVARRNTQSGISVQNGCTVRGNTCSDNALGGPNAAGIQAFGPSNRIEDNHCIGGEGFGIWVTASGNLIIRNSCSANNVNWTIFSGCPYGPVINRSGLSVSGAAGSGTVPSTLATTDAHANFTI